eukprot:419684-Pleurochrysis_carterae.AAC.1
MSYPCLGDFRAPPAPFPRRSRGCLETFRTLLALFKRLACRHPIQTSSIVSMMGMHSTCARASAPARHTSRPQCVRIRAARAFHALVQMPFALGVNAIRGCCELVGA